MKLIDVQPEDAVSNIPAEGAEPARKVEMGGFELMIANKVYRARFLLHWHLFHFSMLY